jgi:hypothetical protein
MALFRSYPVEKIINGFRVETSESVIVTHSGYETNGESSIVVKGPSDQEMILTLNKETTDHLTIKSMCNLLIRSEDLIDEEYGEIQLDKFSSVELKFIGEHWYILSSDGLKNS